MEQLFIKASRHKLRFTTAKGQISAEDLWDLNLEALDKLAKALNKEVKEEGEVSFIKKQSTKSTLLSWRFEIVKYVIEVKLAEEEEAKNKAQKEARKIQLMELIDKKELASMEGKSIEELKRELAEL